MTLIDLILTVCRHDIDNLSCLYDATVCPEQFLPKLGDTLNYKYDDDYGRTIGTYFKSVYDYLNDNKLWAAVPQYAQNEIENNIKLLTVENKNSTWKGTKWRMVVYKKRSKYRQ